MPSPARYVTRWPPAGRATRCQGTDHAHARFRAPTRPGDRGHRLRRRPPHPALAGARLPRARPGARSRPPGGTILARPGRGGGRRRARPGNAPGGIGRRGCRLLPDPQHESATPISPNGISAPRGPSRRRPRPRVSRASSIWAGWANRRPGCRSTCGRARRPESPCARLGFRSPSFGPASSSGPAASRSR